MVMYLHQEYGVDVRTRSRRDEIVVPRVALFNVCRGYFSASTLAKSFGMNHATILHHWKNHDVFMTIKQYRVFCDDLMNVLERYDSRSKARRKEYQDELSRLRDEVEELKIRLLRYEEGIEAVHS